jgi:hypothetical protein
MEFAQNLFSGLHQRVNAAGEAVPAHYCDWQGLSAQLQAAHAVRTALYRAQAKALRPQGGAFMSATTAAQLGSANCSQPVNRTALADGKAPEGIVIAAAAQFAGDGRG